jgi:hypothetical protein
VDGLFTPLKYMELNRKERKGDEDEDDFIKGA